MYYKPLFCSKIAQKVKRCSRLLKQRTELQWATPKACLSEAAERNRDRPTLGLQQWLLLSEAYNPEMLLVWSISINPSGGLCGQKWLSNVEQWKARQNHLDAPLRPFPLAKWKKKPFNIKSQYVKAFQQYFDFILVLVMLLGIRLLHVDQESFAAEMRSLMRARRLWWEWMKRTACYWWASVRPRTIIGTGPRKIGWCDGR